MILILSELEEIQLQPTGASRARICTLIQTHGTMSYTKALGMVCCGIAKIIKRGIHLRDCRRKMDLTITAHSTSDTCARTNTMQKTSNSSRKSSHWDSQKDTCGFANESQPSKSANPATHPIGLEPSPRRTR